MFFTSIYKNVFILILFIFSCFVSPVFSQTTNISGIVNTYTPVTLILSCSIEVLDASAFNVGNRVVIIQMKGADIDTTNSPNFGNVLNLNTCGNYEFSHISDIAGNTIFFTDSLQRSYNVAGSVQLILVPQYTDAIITAPVTCPDWNGSIGGIAIIECSGSLTFNDDIDVRGKGFALGNVSPTGYNCPGSFDYYYPSTSYFGAEKGEGISILSPSKRNGMGKRANGGGGGNNVNAGGGGGANFGGGGNGGFSWEGCPVMDIGGRGGQALSYSNLLNKIFLGGGGGGGQQNDLQATPGTNGGGIVIVRANSITGNGYTVNASAFAVLTGGCDGTGGGGGGGSVLLDVNTFNGTLNVNAKGGDGAFPTCYLQGASGGGGGGCIWSKTPLPANVPFNVSEGIRGIHGSGSQDGFPGDTLSGLAITGTPFMYNPFNYSITASSPIDTLCLGMTATLNVSPNGPGFTYAWTPAVSLNDTTIYNPVASPLINTAYSVVLTYPNGCRVIDTITVFIKPKPVAAFNNTTVCNSNTTVFTDNSTTVSGTISTWAWDFGDGSSINNSSSPSHIYSNAGNYNVTLIVKNNFGCSDTITKSVQVYYNPVAGFNYSDVCHGDSMYFTNTSFVDSAALIVSYLWVFGDGSATSSLKNPSHFYSVPGTFTVTLVVTTADGCSDVKNMSVTVFDPPTTAFTFSNTCLPDVAQFTNTTVDPTMASATSWSWNFGDGSPIDTAAWNVSHLYASPGTYQVTLITHSSNLGCPDTLQDSITIFPQPVADFNFTDVCLTQAMNFNDLSLVSGGTITGVLWDFDDGTPFDTVQGPNHTYADPGTYMVSLIVTSNTNCKDTIIKSVVVHPLPSAQYSASNVCEGNSVQFNDLSTIPIADTLQSTTWDFGDGSPFSNTQNASHLYAVSGSYPVQLVVVSGFGCSDSISKTCIINPNPIVNFTTNDTIGCEPLCVNFQNTSFIATGTYISQIWNFGEGSTSSDPDHCYINDFVSSPGFFNVTLTVASDSGCVSSLSKNNYITVYPNPEADFSVQPQTATITNPVISVIDASLGTDFWNWNFGDDSVEFNLSTADGITPPPHTYADTGAYTIMLIAKNQYGCMDTFSQTVVIEPDFLFHIPNAFTPDDDGINDTFSGKGIFISNFEMMIFDRWGIMVFFSDNINKPWDGKINHGNEIAQRDVYVYSIKITDYKGGIHNYKGIVTLVR